MDQRVLLQGPLRSPQSPENQRVESKKGTVASSPWKEEVRTSPAEGDINFQGRECRKQRGGKTDTNTPSIATNVTLIVQGGSRTELKNNKKRQTLGN